MADCIDRQAVIDMFQRMAYDDWNQGVSTTWANAFSECADMAGDIPSVDVVEVVRCKDCKYWIPYDWMFSEVWKSQNIDDYAESEIGCTYCDMSMGAMDYCSRGERKDE